MIVCWLFDSEINYLNLQLNPNYTQTKLQVRWDGGIWRYQNICTAMTNLVHHFWHSNVKNSPRRRLKGCCMVRLLSVLLVLSHLVVWINTALSAVSVNDHRGKYNLCMSVNFDGLLRYFSISHLTFKGRGQSFFVQLVPFATLINFSPNLANLSVILSNLARIKSIKSLTDFVKWGKKARSRCRKTAKASAKQGKKVRKRWSKDLGDQNW